MWQRFLRWLRSRQPVVDTAGVIVVRVSAEQYELLHWWSLKSGIPLDMLLLKGGLHSIPSDERRRFAARKAYEPMLAALDADAEDGLGHVRGVFPLPPKTARTEEAVEDVPSAQRWWPDHSCVFAVNEPAVIGSMEVTSAGGVCWRKEQRGRACHWPANAASQCTLYQARVVRRG